MVSSQGALSRCFSKVCASGEDDPGGGMIGFYSDGHATQGDCDELRTTKTADLKKKKK
jgi:hypothetical protein